jgi:hypothetical protein
MKRDWDLLREQLLAIEGDLDFKRAVLGAVSKTPIWLDDQSESDFIKASETHQKLEARVFGHLEMLVDNGYVEGVKILRSGNTFHFGLMHPRLTMAGHDLLDTIRSQQLWEKIKSTGKTKGIELTFDTIKALAAYALKSLLGG